MKDINKLNEEVNNTIDKLVKASEYLMNETDKDLSLFANMSVAVEGIDKIATIVKCLNELKELFKYIKSNKDVIGVDEDVDVMFRELEGIALHSIGTFKANLNNSGMELKDNGSGKITVFSIK